ncbi:unnamed protein product [Dicrocoelium dendriticum]|nr:unnamed protein product [Dicrocoelium dendriticum]
MFTATRVFRAVITSFSGKGRFHSCQTVAEFVKEGYFSELIPTNSEKYLHEAQDSSVYLGIDPSAPSLQVGNLVAIIGLLRCHLLGYGVIAVIGTGTASIGDPSGRVVKRSVQTTNQYEVNAAGIEQDLQRILRNYRDHFLPRMCTHTHLKSINVLRNGDWLNAVGFTAFLNEFAHHLRVPELLEKESVKVRLASGKGMDLSEFLYPALQAMDFAHLHTNYNCRIQIGGQDQLGNIHVGLTMLQRKLGKHAFGLLVPLLTTPDGKKFGKSDTDPGSESTMLWLSKEKVLPFHLFQRILNLPDNMASTRLLRQLTFLSREEIDSLMMEHKLSPDTRPVQRAIAREVTLLVHGSRHDRWFLVTRQQRTTSRYPVAKAREI